MCCCPGFFFPDGLVASDGRLQPEDQIIEINGFDLTCASHTQVIHFLLIVFNNLSLLIKREDVYVNQTTSHLYVKLLLI
jgi:hypothetical protein